MRHPRTCPLGDRSGDGDCLRFDAVGARHEYWERNRTLLVVVAIITVGSPLIGLAVAGLSGVAIGLVLGVVADYVGAKAVVRVQVVERGHAD